MGGPKKSSIDRVIAEITDKPLTIPVISDDADLSIPTTQKVIRLLRAQNDVYIETWIRIDAGAMYRWVAAYRFGAGKDKPRPICQTPEERRAANRLYKKRQIIKKMQTTEAMKRANIRAELERPAFRHPHDEWLFGPAPQISSCGKVKTRVFRQTMEFADTPEPDLQEH